jgi:hypothetical protein
MALRGTNDGDAGKGESPFGLTYSPSPAPRSCCRGGFDRRLFVVTCVDERRELLELLALLALAEPPKSLKPEAPSGLEMEEPL